MRNELILMLDDNEENRRLVRDVLQVNGYRTLDAATALEGLRLAADHSPPLILLDVQLPDMEGLAALRHLKRDARTADIAAMALTAFAMDGDREWFLGARFDGYAPKPIDTRAFPDQVAVRMVGRPQIL
jgi:CheY-like chemotaxis protein